MDDQATVTDQENLETQNSKNKEQEVEIFSWEGPIRPIVKHSHDFWLSLVVIGGVVGLVFYLIEGMMPLLMIIALGFLYFVLNTVKPERVRFSITNKGVRIGEKMMEWIFLYRYWFSHWMGNDLLVFQTAQIGGRMEIVINKEDKDKIRKALDDYLDEEKVPPSNIDKFAIWFSENMERRKNRLSSKQA